MIDTDTAGTIFRIIQDLQASNAYNGSWMPIPAVRDIASTAGISRTQFDSLMIEMVKLGIVSMVPQDIQASLTDADRYNGILIPGGERQDMVTIN